MRITYYVLRGARDGKSKAQGPMSKVIRAFESVTLRIDATGRRDKGGVHMICNVKKDCGSGITIVPLITTRFFGGLRCESIRVHTSPYDQSSKLYEPRRHEAHEGRRQKKRRRGNGAQGAIEQFRVDTSSYDRSPQELYEPRKMRSDPSRRAGDFTLLRLVSRHSRAPGRGGSLCCGSQTAGNVPWIVEKRLVENH